MTRAPKVGHVLEISGLRAGVSGKEILPSIDLTVRSGEVHAVMGPNGSGKSTLAPVVMGRPGYRMLGGTVTLGGVDILALDPWHARPSCSSPCSTRPSPRACRSTPCSSRPPGRAESDVMAVDAAIPAEAQRLTLDPRLIDRPLNVDLSGGEKKKNETLQLGVLRRPSPCSTSSTPAWTSTPCGPAPAGWRPPPTRSDSACSPSRTTAASYTS